MSEQEIYAQKVTLQERMDFNTLRTECETYGYSFLGYTFVLEDYEEALEDLALDFDLSIQVSENAYYLVA